MKVTLLKAVKILKNEGVVAIPTETVYGLAGLATSEKAVLKIFTAKNRPADNPSICHFSSISQIQKYIPNLSEIAIFLLETFSPGPSSLLLNLPENSVLSPVTRGQNTIICRIPNHPIALEIIKQVGPLAAPSANTSTTFSATTAEMVENDLGPKIDGIVEGGSCEIGLESTIIDPGFAGEIRILRPGQIGKLAFEKALKKAGFKIKVISKNNKDVTPGAKYRHYSPRTPIYQIQNQTEIPETSNVAVLYSKNLQPFEKNSNFKYIFLGQNIEKISKKLYQNLYKLDKLNCQKAYILEDEFDNSDLAAALKNRLKKILLS